MEFAVLGGAVVLAFYVLPLVCVHSLGRRWLAYWHGEGAAHQHQFYRCQGCRRLVTWHRIHRGGCRCQESYKVAPAVLTLRDKAKVLLLPWSVR